MLPSSGKTGIPEYSGISRKTWKTGKSGKTGKNPEKLRNCLEIPETPRRLQTQINFHLDNFHTFK
jgi:hypothetical protein